MLKQLHFYILALYVASVAVKSGWTFIYLDKDVDCVDGYHLAQQYEPAILFVEDFDRMSSPMRTSHMDLILNTMDGVDTKGDEVFTMMTTNNISYIHDAFLRPGRIDTIVNINRYQVAYKGSQEQLSTRSLIRQSYILSTNLRRVINVN